jgi:hypothetical protein
MPSVYAHYRFGAQLLSQLPPPIQRNISRFRQLYDVGLQGPDILYFLPGGKKFGDKFHQQSGKVFFEHVCRFVRLHPTEATRAYLYGVLAHYALDSLSHPFIHRMAAQGKATHTQIETEFDRFLLDLDGKKPPYLQDLSGHIRLTPGECETVSGFYHQVSAGSIKKSVDNMATATRLLIIPQSRRRELVGKLLQIAGPQVSGRLMTVRPNRSCSNLDPSLLRLYEMAMDRYPVLLEQVRSHLRHNAPLGTDFSVPFG